MNGDVIANRFELEKRIGSGGMANVYLAQDNRLGRRVAIKVLHPEHAADPTFVERFRREARAAASLNHVNIVSIYDWGETGETYFIAMEYVPGSSLKTVLRHGALPEGEALRIVGDVASALEAAHVHGVVHRDVKPQNVLLTPDGRVKVVDFGIARATGLTQLTTTNMVCGTPHYISPEQVIHGAIDGRSDIYSLGVVLFETVTGQEPFQGNSLVEIALKHAHEPAPSPKLLRPTLSSATEAVLLKALAKRPEDRYQSAREFQLALADARGDLLGAPVQDRTTVSPMPVPVPETDKRVDPEPQRVERSGHEPAERGRGYRWLLAAPVLLAFIVAVVAFHVLSGTSGKPAASGRRPLTHHGTTAQAHRRAGTATPSVAVALHPATSVAEATRSPSHTPATTVPLSTPTAVPTDTAVSNALLASADANGPAQAVRQFYWSVAHHNWDAAAALWGPDMAGYDRHQNLNARFGSTVAIAVTTHVLQMDNSAGTAIVAVTLSETRADSSVASELVGRWYLIRRGSKWLLDRPSF